MTIARFVLLSAILILLAVAAVVLVQAQLSEQIEGVPLSAWSIFFGLNGFFFAVLIGLLIASLLARFHRLNAVVRLEASALSQVKRALRHQDESVENSIRADVRNYAAAVLSEEWPEMAARNRVLGDAGAMGQLHQLVDRIRDLELDTDLDPITRRMLIDSVVGVTNLRAERLHLSAEQLSPLVRLVVFFLSLVIVFSFTLIDVGSLGIHILMVALLGVAVALLNLGLADLSRPLVGVWKVSPDPLRQVARMPKPKRSTARSRRRQPNEAAHDVATTSDVSSDHPTETRD